MTAMLFSSPHWHKPATLQICAVFCIAEQRVILGPTASAGYEGTRDFFTITIITFFNWTSNLTKGFYT